MHSNTLNTLWGYLKAVLERRTPVRLSGDSLNDIYNYLPLNERLSTSGQPTAAQFHQISEAGFRRVINLAPSSFVENSLEDEAALLRQLGIEYIHIPVDFYNPTEQDFEAFCNAMQADTKNKLWVHCAANAGVSAFMYRYRVQFLGEDRTLARTDMLKIWEPFGAMKSFAERAK